MSFSTGLQNVLDQIDASKSQYNSIQSDEFVNYLMKLNTGSKYKCRVLVEQSEFVSFEEYNFVAVNFIKKDGTVKPGNMSFLATKDENDHLQGTVIVNPKDGKASPIRARKVLAVPVFVSQEKKADRNSSSAKPEVINETKLLILPPGKNSAIWKSLLECSEETGSLTDKYIQFQRSGEGTDTTWTITPLAPSEFAEKEMAEDMSPERVSEIIKGSRRWAEPKETEYVKLRNKKEDTMSDADKAYEDEVASNL